MSSEIQVEYKTPRKLKWLIVFLSVYIAGSIFWINYVSDLKNTVNMFHPSFTDIGDLVSAEGAWLSADVELANPLQAVEIFCWQQFNHCFINYAEIVDSISYDTSYLSTYSEVFEIDRWTPDVIETVPTKSGFGCVETQLRMDRRSETVTFTRRTIENKTSACEGVDGKSFTLTLGDGEERIRQAKTRK